MENVENVKSLTVEFYDVSVLNFQSEYSHESDIALGVIHNHHLRKDSGFSLTKVRPKSSTPLMVFGYGQKSYRVDPEDDPTTMAELKGRKASCAALARMASDLSLPDLAHQLRNPEQKLMNLLLGRHCEAAFEGKTPPKYRCSSSFDLWYSSHDLGSEFKFLHYGFGQLVPKILPGQVKLLVFKEISKLKVVSFKISA